jgi:hypothetical protein
MAVDIVSSYQLRAPGSAAACLLILFYALAAFSPVLTPRAQSESPLPTEVDVSSRPADMTIFESHSAQFKKVLTGDFDGDGIDDLLITNDVAEGLARLAGRAYVLFGSREIAPPVSVNLANGEEDFAVLGNEESLRLGAGANAGDLNGDGIDDIILSALQARRPDGRTGGAIYVLFGSPDLPGRGSKLADSDADVIIMGDQFERLDPGLAVGDINADGVSDLLFGSNRGGHEKVNVFLGPVAPGSKFDLTTDEADVTITGGLAVDGFGIGLEVADVSGDGVDDILIGAPRVGRDRWLDAGLLHVLFGSPRLTKGTAISLSKDQADVTVLGAFAGTDFGLGDRLGEIVSTGDVNGDGIADIMLGAPGSVRIFDDRLDVPAGEVYVIFGSPALAGRIIDTRQNQQDVTIRGAEKGDSVLTQSGDKLGSSIISRDVDGDGTDDLLIGAPRADGKKNKKNDSGEAYLVLGSREWQSGEVVEIARHQQDITFWGRGENDGLGGRVASGDLNGDGYADMIISSAEDGPAAGQTNSGVIYVYFGNQILPPEITKAKYKKGSSKLLIYGEGLSGSAKVEINGIVLEREIEFDPQQERLVVKGNRDELNLRRGQNEVVIIRKGVRSNRFNVKA